MWWMPWRSQAMKDVVACEKSRGASKRALIREYPNGETRSLHNLLLERTLCERNASTKVVCNHKKREGDPPPKNFCVGEIFGGGGDRNKKSLPSQTSEEL